MKILTKFLLATAAIVLLSPDARTQPAETPPDETSIEEPEGEIGGIVVLGQDGRAAQGS